MTELSPAANAVLTAVTLKRYDVPPEGLSAFAEEMAPLIAAALRAAADQIRLDKALGNTDADAGVLAAHHAIYAYLLAIAAELEAQ